MASRWFGVAGDFGQYYSSYDFGQSAKTLTFLAGSRVFLPARPSARLRPFGDFLIGGAQSADTNFASTQKFTNSLAFAWAADGGVDYRLRPRWALRVQGGFLYAHYKTEDHEVQQFVPAGHPRISVGAAYKF